MRDLHPLFRDGLASARAKDARFLNLLVGEETSLLACQVGTRMETLARPEAEDARNAALTLFPKVADLNELFNHRQTSTIEVDNYSMMVISEPALAGLDRFGISIVMDTSVKAGLADAEHFG